MCAINNQHKARIQIFRTVGKARGRPRLEFMKKAFKLQALIVAQRSRQWFMIDRIGNLPTNLKTEFQKFRN